MENQTENTNVTTENKPQSEPLHKSFCRESIVVLYPSCRIDFICCSKQRHSYIS